MKKSIEFSLVPDENKLYNAKMFKDNSLFKEEKVDAETMKYYMLQKMSEKELINLRTAVKLFKTKKIKLHLKGTKLKNFIIQSSKIETKELLKIYSIPANSYEEALAILNKKNSKDYLVEKKNFKTEEPEFITMLNIEEQNEQNKL